MCGLKNVKWLEGIELLCSSVMKQAQSVVHFQHSLSIVKCEEDKCQAVMKWR